ncbi:hypothetical protein Rhopal_005375-T1 [Rhodotorula paludigena]|uniref:E3 ubiquitin-protein ligase n=1 Tax=Rhodotorula paludigena TaxID=86838 RepID=A0AAV5GI78_9BASI|nr:hypothetical protein Rhopal_005375-T1 [Rhodotorula paludigena]
MPAPPPFPEPHSAMHLEPADLGAYFDALAPAASFSLAQPSARARVKLALYGYALCPHLPFRSLFFPDAGPDPRETAAVSDDWSIASAQQRHSLAHASSSSAGAPAHEDDADEYSPARRGKPCGHVFRAGESVYRCRDCALDATCVLCARCFHASSHARLGHDVTVSTHAGVGAGCCDCGDAEAWNEGCQQDCRYHAAAPPSSAPAPSPPPSAKGKERATDTDDDAERIEAAKQRAHDMLAAALDWALDVLERSPELLVTPSRVEEITGVPRPADQAPEADQEEEEEDATARTPRATLASLATLLRAGGGTTAQDPEAFLRALAGAEGTTVLMPDQAAAARAAADEEVEVEPDADADAGGDDEVLGDLDAQIQAHFARRGMMTVVQMDEDGNTVEIEVDLGNAGGAGAGVAEDDDDDDAPAATLGLPGSFPLSTAPTVTPASASASAAPAPLPAPTTPPYAVVLWNDELHSFQEVISQVSLATHCSRATAQSIANHVDTHGRSTILVTPSAPDALRAARKVAQIKLAVTVREARETFREDVALEVVLCARDLLRARLAGESGALAETVAHVVLERAGDGRSRFMRWCAVEGRLWKAARKAGQELAVALVGVSSEVKMELSIQYAEIYSSLATTYLLTDREPENSLIFFGVQVFTVPSVAAVLVSRHYFLSRLLKVLFAFFTGQLSPDKTRLVLPPNPSIRTLDLENPHIKQKRHSQPRYFQLFSDLTHLVECTSVQRLIASSPHLVDDFASFIDLFSGMNPLHRAVGAHVEYESEQWVTAFNLTIQLARLARAFGEAFHPAAPSPSAPGADIPPSTLDLARALNTLLHKLNPAADDDWERPTHRLELAGRSYGPLYAYRVSTEPVSYHHPLAWLWAEMAKGLAGPADRASEDKLARIGVQGGVRALLGGLERDGARENRVLPFVAAMEQPLRVVALVAQVRAGVWVRNGFGVRAQNLHYRDYSLRETTFEQDVFFLQTALVVLDPSLVVAALVDRFELREWLVHRAAPVAADGAAPGAGSSYEPEQALALIDELLNLLITLVTDPTAVVPLSSTAALRRELVHYLALGPSVYSDLVRRVSERYSDDPQIDRLLAQVATFKPPTGTNDQGVYSLRDELVGEVDPYFSRYTRNQREEVDKVVRAWLKKRAGPAAANKDVEPVIVPNKLAVVAGESGPFVRLTETLGSEALLATVFYALRAGSSLARRAPPAPAEDGAEAPAAAQPPFSEAVVDQALQLVLLAQVEQPAALRDFALRSIALEDADSADAKGTESLAQVLVRIEEDERLKGVWGKAKHVLDWLAAELGEAISGLRRQPAAAEGAETEASDAAKAAEAKRAAAKARQAAIMKQFQQAQSAFLQNVEDDEDEDGDMAEGDEAKLQEAAKKPKVHFGDCIVCQDELEDSAPFGMLALIQGSNLIRVTPVGGEDDDVESRISSEQLFHLRQQRQASDAPQSPYQREILDLPGSLDRDVSHARPYGVAARRRPISGFANSDDGLAEGFPQATKAGLHASSCGHMMHLSCFERYCASLQHRHSQQRDRCHPENLDRREFVCPLCKSLGNVLLPAEVDSPAFVPYSGPLDKRTLSEWGNPDADPLEDGSLDRFDENVCKRVEKLTSSDARDRTTFKPWRATMALPMLLPGHFNEAEGRMVARLLQVVTAINSEIGGPGTFAATLSGDLVGYTVSTLEIASRGTGEPAWSLSDANVKLLQSLVAVMQDLAELMTQSVESSRIAAISLRQRLLGAFAHGQALADEPFTQCDPIGVLIETAVCMPSAFYHVVAVAFYAALAQNLLAVYRMLHRSSSPRAVWNADKVDERERQECADLVRVREVFAMAPALFAGEDQSFLPTVGKHLHAQMLVFLRRASILARIVFGEPSDDATDAFLDDDRSEYARLLELLRIPPPSEVLRFNVLTDDGNVSALRDHLRACANSVRYPLFDTPDREEAIVAISTSTTLPTLEHPVPYELLGLPHQLDTLVAASLETKCKSCGEVPKTPALCLFCGETLCAMSFCCMVGEGDSLTGECNEHMWTCGGSVGVFYLIKRNVLLYLHADKGAFSTPPYLDSHGEVDVGGRRSRSQFPQFLHRGRYDEVRRMWLTHGIPTYVARKLEAVTDHGGWQSF